MDFSCGSCFLVSLVGDDYLDDLIIKRRVFCMYWLIVPSVVGDIF